MTEDNTELLQSLYRKVPRVAMTMQIIRGLGQELSFIVLGLHFSRQFSLEIATYQTH